MEISIAIILMLAVIAFLATILRRDKQPPIEKGGAEGEIFPRKRVEQ